MGTGKGVCKEGRCWVQHRDDNRGHQEPPIPVKQPQDGPTGPSITSTMNAMRGPCQTPMTLQVTADRTLPAVYGDGSKVSTILDTQAWGTLLLEVLINCTVAVDRTKIRSSVSQTRLGRVGRFVQSRQEPWARNWGRRLLTLLGLVPGR
jgi:hypothetical protein